MYLSCGSGCTSIKVDSNLSAQVVKLSVALRSGISVLVFDCIVYLDDPSRAFAS
jgi:hypothetical protein